MSRQTETLRNGQAYSAPSITVFAAFPEGVLCASGDFTINEFVRDDDALNF